MVLLGASGSLDPLFNNIVFFLSSHNLCNLSYKIRYIHTTEQKNSQDYTQLNYDDYENRINPFTIIK